MEVETIPLTLQLALHLSGSREGPLHDGDVVASGDRIQVSIVASGNAHLYLAYCTPNRQLAVYPTQGSLKTSAGTLVDVPSLRVDSNTGPEALYVILSRANLSSIDPRLASAIAAAQRDGVTADCGGLAGPAASEPSLRPAAPAATARPARTPGLAGAATSASAATSPKVRPPANSTSAPARSTVGSSAPDAGPTRGLLRRELTPHAETGTSADPADQHFRGIAVFHDPGPRPVVTIERGMYVSHNGLAEVTVQTDVNGIAVLRYRFQHVAAPP